MRSSGWDVSNDSEPEDSLNSGKFSHVGEEPEVQFDGGKGEWRLHGGSREFTMREWGEEGRVGDEKRREEGGEWDLKSVWEKSRVAYSDSGCTDELETQEMDEEESRVCCCNVVSGVKTLVTLSAVINLATIATGGVGFTLGLVDYWGDQDLFTSVMVIIAINAFIRIIVNGVFIIMVVYIVLIFIIVNSVHDYQ